MRSDFVVFQIGISNERDRPMIDDTKPENNRYNWGAIGNILRGTSSKRDYSPPEITVDDPSAMLWDYFLAPAGPALVSRRLRDYFLSVGSQCFSFLPALINEHEYYLIADAGSIDCLDRDRSKLMFAPDNPNKVALIREYVIRTELLHDPLLFSIPEFPLRLLCTEGVRREVESRRFRGLRFTTVALA
jgi:hypothetical protein